MKRIVAVTACTALLAGAGASASMAEPRHRAPLPNITVTPELHTPWAYTGPGSSVSPNFVQGIKNADTADSYYIVGTSGKTNSDGGFGVVYEGPVDNGSTANGPGSGTWTPMSVPASFNAIATSIYGVNNLPGSDVQLVGTYSAAPVGGSGLGNTYGFFYQGPVTSTPDDADWVSVQAVGRDRKQRNKPADQTYLHSVDGDSPVVGNYDFFGEREPAGHAFLWDPDTRQQTDIKWKGHFRTHTAYGIWANGPSAWADGRPTYTITGGVGLGRGRAAAVRGHYGEALGRAAIIDYDPATGKFTNQRTYTYLNRKEFVTHFEGIYVRPDGSYQMPFLTANIRTQETHAGIAIVTRDKRGRFSERAQWITFSSSDGDYLTNNSTYGPISIGVFKPTGGGAQPYANVLYPCLLGSGAKGPRPACAG